MLPFDIGCYHPMQKVQYTFFVHSVYSTGYSLIDMNPYMELSSVQCGDHRSLISPLIGTHACSLFCVTTGHYYSSPIAMATLATLVQWLHWLGYICYIGTVHVPATTRAWTESLLCDHGSLLVSHWSSTTYIWHSAHFCVTTGHSPNRLPRSPQYRMDLQWFTMQLFSE